jgi:DmsE family decaheme c-type cytochrome
VLFAGLLVLSTVVALLTATRPARAASSGTPAQEVTSPPGGYAGVKECVSCHAVQVKAYRESPHARDWDERTPAAAQACDTCHGPAKSHIEDPGDKARITSFLRMTPRAVSETCLRCHKSDEHAQWQGSMHDARNVSCISCHSVHTPQSEKAQLRKVSVTETCAQCHRDKAARVLRASHMPVREGKLECTTCHNQHGSTNVRLLRVGNTVNEFCVSCHAEKRGPFLWDHPPVRENCNTCHDPHGTSNERLLVAKPPMLCQRCHVAAQHPSTVYDAVAVSNKSNRVIGRGCVNCHSNIHGSNHPAGSRFHR